MPTRKECQEIVDAIRRGGVDALVVAGDRREEVVILQGSEHPYRFLVESFTDGAATLDGAGTILYVNKRFAEILGVPRRKLLGTTLLDHTPWRGKQALKRLLRKRTHGETVLKIEGERERTIRFSIGPAKGAHRRHLYLIATELTDLVNVTAALKSSEQSLRDLSARLLKIQDDERRHIARDLHDLTGQSLAVQMMMLSEVLKRGSVLDEEVRQVLTECAEINKRVSQEVRTVSYLLHPPLLDEFGVASAIKWFISGFETRSGISIALESDPDFPRLPPDVEIALFRVVQESLTNVHRHSGSTTAAVRLKYPPGKILLEIEDFGKGAGAETRSSGMEFAAALGVGVQGMRERLRQLSGKLEIDSRENQGTLVTAVLPLHATQRSPLELESPKPPAAEPRTRRKAKAAKASN